MLRRLWPLLTSIIVFTSIPHHAVAAEINATNYDIYIGDVDGEGTKDFFFKAKTFPLILHGNIITPLIISRGVDFVIYRNGNNYKLPPVIFTSYTSTVIATKLANGTLKKAISGTDYETLTSAQGQSKLLLKSGEIGVWNLTLVSSPSSTLPTVTVNESSSTTEPAVGSAQLAWRNIVNGMLNNNPQSISQYFDPSVASSYQQIFSVLGTELTDIAKNLGTLELLYSTDSIAVFLVSNKDGGDYVNTVTFQKDSQGNWKVKDL